MAPPGVDPVLIFTVSGDHAQIMAQSRLDQVLFVHLALAVPQLIGETKTHNAHIDGVVRDRSVKVMGLVSCPPKIFRAKDILPIQQNIA